VDAAERLDLASSTNFRFLRRGETLPALQGSNTSASH
jgi:hypothetical protein